MISANQSAFVPGWLIHDNSILAHVIFHALNQKRGKRGQLALKIDMSQAFDRMKWNLIRLALKQFGLSPQWINWVRECVSSVSYSLLLNGSPFGFILPSRGLRQGDPLFPFLFVIGMELLSRMLDKARDLSRLQGIQTRTGGPLLLHLL